MHKRNYLWLKFFPTVTFWWSLFDFYIKLGFEVTHAMSNLFGCKVDAISFGFGRPSKCGSRIWCCYKTYFAKLNGDEKTKPTTIKLLSEHCEAFKVIPTAYLALKLGVTLRASTAKCENSFSVLKTIKRDRRQSMKHARKAYLVKLVFESSLTKN